MNQKKIDLNELYEEDGDAIAEGVTA